MSNSTDTEGYTLYFCDHFSFCKLDSLEEARLAQHPIIMLAIEIVPTGK